MHRHLSAWVVPMLGRITLVCRNGYSLPQASSNRDIALKTLSDKRLLETGVQSKQEKTCGTCQNRLKVEQSLWTFVRVEGIQLTNKGAERALRRAVLWRKKSFWDAE